MSKIFKTSDDIVELIENKFAETGLEPYGINLKILSTVKSKEVITIAKESAKTEFLAKSKDMVSLIVYEALFDRLPLEEQKILIEMFLSGISYDSEKDKISIEKNPIKLILNVRKKYKNIIDILELVEIIKLEIIEEEKEKKRQEKENKMKKKNEYK